MPEKKINDDTLLGTLHDQDYVKLKETIEGVVASKIFKRIKTEKQNILNKVREL